jgi:hypothetical protein
MAHDSTIAVDEGQGTGQASVEAAGQRLRGANPPGFARSGSPIRPSNRHMTIVW